MGYPGEQYLVLHAGKTYGFIVIRFHTDAFLVQSYWNADELHVTSNTAGGRSGKDANSVLASIHTFDAAAGCDAATFQPCSDKALANLKAYVDTFRSIYTLNKGIPSYAAVATGRYSEDVYFGGNVSVNCCSTK